MFLGISYPGFYSGRIAEAIISTLQEHGSVMELEDLAAHHTSFVNPITTTYRDYHVYELPPPTQVKQSGTTLLFVQSEPMLSAYSMQIAPASW